MRSFVYVLFSVAISLLAGRSAVADAGKIPPAMVSEAPARTGDLKAELTAEAIAHPEREVPWGYIEQLRRVDHVELLQLAEGLSTRLPVGSPAFLQLRTEEVRLAVIRQDMAELRTKLADIAPHADSLGTNSRIVLGSLYTDAPTRGEPDDVLFSQLEVARNIDDAVGKTLHSDPKYLMNLATVEINNAGGNPGKARELLREAKPLLPDGRTGDQFLLLWQSVRADTLRGALLEAQQELGDLKKRTENPTQDEKQWADLLTARGDISWLYKEIVRIGNERERERKKLSMQLNETVQSISLDRPVVVGPIDSPKPASSASARLPAPAIASVSAYPSTYAILAFAALGGAALAGLWISKRSKKFNIPMYLLAAGIAVASLTAKASDTESDQPITRVGDISFVPTIKFGDVPEGAMLRGEILLKNDSAKDKILQLVKKECGCTSVPLTVKIPAHSSAPLPLGLSTGGKQRGKVSTRALYADVAEPKNLYIVGVSAIIHDPVMTPIRVRLDDKAPGENVEFPASIISPSAWRIKSVIGSAADLKHHTVRIGIAKQKQTSFVAQLTTPENVGVYDGFYEATIESPSGQVLTIGGRITGEVHNPFFQEQGEIAMGVYSKKEKTPIVREIIARGPIELSEIQFPKSIHAEVIQSDPKGETRLKLTCSPPDGAALGSFEEQMRIHLGGAQYILVPIVATIID